MYIRVRSEQVSFAHYISELPVISYSGSLRNSLHRYSRSSQTGAPWRLLKSAPVCELLLCIISLIRTNSLIETPLFRLARVYCIRSS